jgi:endonuclease YncB( thermonuclease family)
LGNIVGYGPRRPSYKAHRPSRLLARFWSRIIGGIVALAVVGAISVFNNLDSSAFGTIGSAGLLGVSSSASISVTDGDTIKVGGWPVRLVGFNAPETYRAACASEKKIGDRATRRLEQLLASGSVRFVEVACSCPAGTEGTEECNFGRACGTLSAGGRDVGAVLISEGLAVPFHCGSSSCPQLPRPWCG